VSRRQPRLHRTLPIAFALGAACLLAGCGVKGPLDRPPYAAASDPVLEAPAGTPTPAPSLPGTTVGTTTAAVVQAPSARQRSMFDWLLD
jgi:predicted small lipoprotein YifL